MKFAGNCKSRSLLRQSTTPDDNEFTSRRATPNQRMKYVLSILPALLCLTLLPYLVRGQGGRSFSRSFLSSPMNLTADLEITSMPTTFVGSEDTIVITWTGTTTPEYGILHYGLNPGMGIPGLYAYTIIDSSHLDTLIVLGSELNIGLLFCMISTPSGLLSAEFMMVRESDDPVQLISPRSSTGGIGGITTTTPLFQWNAVPNVPYYHLLLSDQPFEIEEDSLTGEIQTYGANIIWQAITPNTSIVYGTLDPSGFYVHYNYPPLIGNLPGEPRPTYNWAVLNNYGNNPTFSSDVVGDLMAFEVNTPPPFALPELLSPVSPPDTLTVVSSDSVEFTWSYIPQASNYHLYLTRLEIRPGGSTAYIPLWYVQTTITAVLCPAAGLLSNGEHRWKVIAEDNQGRGTMSEPADFYYSINNQNIWLQVVLQGTYDPVMAVQVDFIPIQGPTLQPTLTDDGGFANKDMPYGTYRFQFSKDGYATLTSDAFVVDENTPSGTGNIYRYEIQPLYSSVFGTVIDNNNDPLSFADVTARNTSTGAEETTQSNNSGVFSISLTPANYSFIASKDGYTSSQTVITNLPPNVTVNLDSISGPLRLTLNLYSITGRVVNLDNQPIALARVTCVKGQESYEYTTGANGNFEFQVSNGTWTLRAEKPAFWISSEPRQVVILNASSHNNILQLSPAANIISGQVYQGAVLSRGEALVRAVPSAGPVEEVQVNDQGSYIISLPTGDYQVNAHLEGYTSPTPVSLSLSVGQTISGLDFYLTPNPSYLTGRITSDGSTPLAGAVVTNGNVTDTTDAQGNYALNVSSGQHTVTASKTGYITASSPPVNVAPGQTLENINLILNPNAATINGNVRSNGQPVYLAAVRAKKVSTGAVSMVQTAENGDYTFSITYGTYQIWASKTGYLNSDTLTHTANPGQTIDNVDFNLIRNLGYLAGTTLYNGQGLGQTQINAAALGAPTVNFNTQASYFGDFNLAVTPGYSYEITASKTGYTPGVDTSDIVAANVTQNFQFNLTQLQARVLGGVFSVGGDTLVNATVTGVKRGTGETFTASTNNIGSYTLFLNSGTYDITASKPGYLSFTRDTTLGAGQTLSGYSFALNPNFAVLLGVVRDSLNPSTFVNNALVTATKVGTQSGTSVHTDPTGGYRLDELVQGSYNVTVTHTRYQTRTVTGVNLLGGSTTTLNIALLGRDGMISGAVRDIFCAPISGATVEAERTGGGSYYAQSLSQGDYSLQNLPSGSYTLSAAKDGYSLDSTSITLTPGDTLSNVDFALIRNDGEINGRVLNPVNQGIPEVEIIANDSSGNAGSAVSAPDGNFTISGLAALNPYHIFLTKTGYTYNSGPLIWPADTSIIAIYQMSRDSLEITGFVVNQSGAPKNNIRVKAVSGTLLRSATTGTNGFYTITQIAPGREYLVYTDLYHPQLANDSVMVNVGAVNIRADTLIMQESSSSISGLVSLAGSGAGNVRVKAVRQDSAMRSTITSGNGSYIIDNLLDGTYRIYPSKQGYRSLPPQNTVVLTVNQHATSVDFSISQIRIDISGRVSDQNDSPVSGAEVTAWPLTEGVDTTLTTVQGCFVFEDRPGLVEYNIATNLPPLEYDNDDSTVYTDTTDVFNLNLTVGVHNSSIAGRVVELGMGTPLAEVSVILNNREPIYTDSLGEFSFVYLPADSYGIALNKSGYIAREVQAFLADSQNLALGDIQLERLTNAIYGTVTNQTLGTEIPNVVITLVDTGSTLPPVSDTTSATGVYYCDNLNPNYQYRLCAEKKGFLVFNGAPLIVNSPFDFRIIPLSNSVYGTIRDTLGLVQENAEVCASDFGANIYSDSTNAFGDYSFILNPGNYQLHAVRRALDSYYRNTSLISGASATENLRILDTGKLRGGLRNAVSGLAVSATAVITLENTVNHNLITSETDAYGNFFVEGLRQNLYTVSTQLPGFNVVNSPQSFTPVLGDTAAIEFLVLSTSNAVTGFVRDSISGEAVGGANVLLHRDTSPDTLSAMSMASGSFSFSDLEGGSYSLWASKVGFLPSALHQFDVYGDTTVQRNLSVVSQSGAISGRAINTQTSGPLENAMIILKATLNDTTYSESDGTYIIHPPASGDYVLLGEKAGYQVQPDSYAFHFDLSQSITGKDFRFTAEIDTIMISGAALHRNDSLPDIAIIYQSFISGKTDTAITDTNGFYIFEEVLSPDQIQLRAERPGFPLQLSPVYDLTAADITHDFRFPAGQITFLVTSDGDTGLPYIGINILNRDYGIDLDLETDILGFALTPDNLLGNDSVAVPYTISFTDPRPYTVPLQPLTVRLTQDENRLVELIPGVSYEPIDTVQVDDSIWVDLYLPNQLIELPDLTAKLLYRRSSESGFTELTMGLVGPANAGSPIKLSTVRGEYRLNRSESSQRAGKRHSSYASLTQAEGYITPGGEDQQDGYSLYRAAIPPQGRSGTIYYKFRVDADSLIYASDISSFFISSEEMLAILRLEPDNSSVQVYYTRDFAMTAYNDRPALLTDHLEAVVWEHWDESNPSDSLGALVFHYDTTTSGLPIPTSVTFIPSDTGVVVVRVTASKGEVTLSETASLSIENRPVSELYIADYLNRVEISNRDSLRLTVTAADAQGQGMVPPPLIWSLTPEGIGELIHLSVSQVRFKPISQRIGQLIITATDTITGVSAMFNPEPNNPDEWGLSVVQKVLDTTEVTVNDGAGFSLFIPRGVAPPGQILKLFLKRPSLPKVKKTRSSKEIHMNSYKLTSDVNIPASLQEPMALTLPIPDETQRLSYSIGVWDTDSLRWDEVETACEDGETITAYINSLGEYVVVGESRPLGVENIRLHPNPFSPKVGPLEIIFDLNSRNVTVNITARLLNMRGDLVRTLLNKESLSKGPNQLVTWNGRTDHNMMARNGRYLLHIQVEDPSGTKDYHKTVVLIK